MNYSQPNFPVNLKTWMVCLCFFTLLFGCAGNHAGKDSASAINLGSGIDSSRNSDGSKVTGGPEGVFVDPTMVTYPSSPIANHQSTIRLVSIDPTVVTYPPEQFDDPLEFVNRPVFAFNDVLYRFALIPVSKGYLRVLPDPVLTGVSNFFSNLREPLNAVNHLFQLHGKPAGTSLSRFAVNSTVGIFGLFDPADAWFAIEERRTDLNDTLAGYGVGYGAYIVVPVFGQMDVRKGGSTVVEGLVSPVALLTDNPETLYIQGYDKFHEFAPGAEPYQELRKQSDDPYLFFRNLYLQGVLRDEEYKQK